MNIDDQKRMITELVAIRIKELRRMKSLSQEDLALKANLNPAYFGQVERGIKCPTVDTLYKIAKALDVPLTELVQSDSPIVPTKDYSQQISDLLARIPEEKYPQVMKLFEDIVSLY